MKRLRLLIPMAALVLVLFAVGCSSSESKPKEDSNDTQRLFNDLVLISSRLPEFCEMRLTPLHVLQDNSEGGLKLTPTHLFRRILKSPI